MFRENLIIGVVAAVSMSGVLIAMFFARKADKAKQKDKKSERKKYRKSSDGRKFILDHLNTKCITCGDPLYCFIERRKEKKQLPRFDSEIEQVFRCFTCKIDIVEAYPEGLGDSFARVIRRIPLSPGQC